MSFLPQGDLEVLRGHWVKGGTSGVTKELFLENMLRVRSLGLCCCAGLELEDLFRRSELQIAKPSDTTPLYVGMIVNVQSRQSFASLILKTAMNEKCRLASRFRLFV